MSPTKGSNQGIILNAVSLVFCVIALLVYGMRMYADVFILRSARADTYVASFTIVRVPDSTPTTPRGKVLTTNLSSQRSSARFSRRYPCIMAWANTYKTWTECMLCTVSSGVGWPRSSSYSPTRPGKSPSCCI